MNGQLDLFEPEKPKKKISFPWILFDIGIDDNVWRGVLSENVHGKGGQRLVMYKGRSGETKRYDPVSGCHIVAMPFGVNFVDVVNNILIGEQFINAGKSQNETVNIEEVVCDCLN